MMSLNFHLHRLSILLATLTALAAFSLCFLDIFLQVYTSTRLLLALGCSAFLLGGGTFLISLSRRVFISNSLSEIPKAYVPIQSSDLSRDVFDQIHARLDKHRALVSTITITDGYSKGAGVFKIGEREEVVVFETSIRNTLDILRQETGCNETMHDILCSLPGVEAQDFLDLYNRVVFGHQELEEQEYLHGMKVFAKVLKT